MMLERVSPLKVAGAFGCYKGSLKAGLVVSPVIGVVLTSYVTFLESMYG